MNQKILPMLFLAGWVLPAVADEPAPELEEVVVLASRATLTVRDIPVNTSILDQEAVREASWKPADEILRQVPGFSLLRSADSIAAAPTTSTVSLRGLGGSAASRTLVLLDGIPVHSPYSSEVFWARIPRHRIARIEVVRGGGATAWGNLSLGGVINIVTRQPQDSGFVFDGMAGYPATADLAVSGDKVSGRWTLGGSASWYDTDGYMNLPREQQGPVDEEVRKDHGTISGRVSYALNDRTRLFANASAFRETRHGGSALDINETEIASLQAGMETETPGGSRWAVRVFHDDTGLEDASVRILGDNESEILRAFEERQDRVWGAGLTWSSPVWNGHELTAGADYRWTDVLLDEYSRYNRGAPLDLLTTDSRQDMGGVFIRDHWRIDTKWQLDGSVRWDYVVNSAESELTALLPGTPIGREVYPSNNQSTINGNLGAVYRANDAFSFRAAAYKGFRAPTLRELYHAASTRGGVILVNNPELESENLVGLEGGLDWQFSAAGTLRLTLFRNTVEDLVQNITRGETGDSPGVIEPCGPLGPNETCRELDNVGEMRATGLEVEAAYEPSDSWSFQLSYLYNDTEITRAPDNPQLVGNRVRQAPEHSATARLRHRGRWFDTSLLARYVGQRYEDDLNRLEVDDFLLFDLRFARQINASTELFLAIENLFDEEYEIKVENNGSIEIGRPRFVGLGLRFRR